MRTVISVDPFRCRMWPLHDRLQDQISAATCTAEIQSFRQYGQRIPVLGRPLNADPEHDIELIYGARRLFVARLLRQPLLVEVRELSDQQAIIALDIENRQRLNLSPYERGLSYAHWLRAGHFRSQEEMARALTVSEAHISRLLKLARLPSIVVSAFGSGTQIREAWGLELMDALSDPARRQPILRVARSIAAHEPRTAPFDVLGRLLAAGSGGHRRKSLSRDVVVKDENGTPVFRVRRQSGSMIYLLPPGRTSPSALEEIEQAVRSILVDSRSVKTAAPYAHLRLRGLCLTVFPDARTQVVDRRA